MEIHALSTFLPAPANLIWLPASEEAPQAASNPFRHTPPHWQHTFMIPGGSQLQKYVITLFSSNVPPLRLHLKLLVSKRKLTTEKNYCFGYICVVLILSVIRVNEIRQWRMIKSKWWTSSCKEVIENSLLVEIINITSIYMSHKVNFRIPSQDHSFMECTLQT